MLMAIRRRTAMKQQFLLIFILFTAFQSVSQTYYTGLERMCWTDTKGKIQCSDAPRKWYHLNTVLIDKDSVFIYKAPIRIEKQDTMHSAADGGFYYHLGVIKRGNTDTTAVLTRYNCHYCANRVLTDSLTGFIYPVPKLDTLKLSFTSNGLKIGNTSYSIAKPTKEFHFPSKALFYFDSNSISRGDPRGQYGLISQGVKNFLQTNQLKLDNDTLRVCIERFKSFEDGLLIETLIADSFHIDTANIHFQFLRRDQLKEVSSIENKVVRYIQIGEIIDYWKAAKISLTYKIAVPRSLRKFSEREYSCLLEYNKAGNAYELDGKLPENGWELVEQK
jgi:hypothetical protein